MNREPSTNWAQRMRALPGFTAAAVVFVLVVLVGGGGAAAYAYWSQGAAATMEVTAGAWGPAQPVTGMSCVAGANNKGGLDSLSVQFVPPADADKVAFVLSNGATALGAEEKPVLAGNAATVTLGYTAPAAAYSATYTLAATASYGGQKGQTVSRNVSVRKSWTPSRDVYHTAGRWTWTSSCS